MTNEDISKLARYVAYLHKEVDNWLLRGVSDDKIDFLKAKREAAMDICTMLDCTDRVLYEEAEMYVSEKADSYERKH